jgi:predicted DNA-binding protein
MADTLKRMGRPPLKLHMGTIKTTIRLPEDLHRKLQSSVDANRIAEFVRDAIEREIERRENEGKK